MLVARFAGANEPDKVNQSVYQAFIVAVALAVGVMAPIGYWFAPTLLTMINAAPEVQVEALPYIRILFVFSIGMLLFFMFGGALRAAGDAKTPMRLGIAMTAMNIVLNVVLIRGLGPIPAFGTRGAAMGTAIASGITAGVFLWLLFSDRLVIHFSRTMSYRPNLETHPVPVQVRPAGRVPGHRDEPGRGAHAPVHRLPPGERLRPGRLRGGGTPSSSR